MWHDKTVCISSANMHIAEQGCAAFSSSPQVRSMSESSSRLTVASSLHCAATKCSTAGRQGVTGGGGGGAL